MNDPDPFRWDAQTRGAKIGLIMVGVLLAVLLAVVLVILAGFAWHVVLWVWS
jgi:hypothetical protein